ASQCPGRFGFGQRNKSVDDFHREVFRAFLQLLRAIQLVHSISRSLTRSITQWIHVSGRVSAWKFRVMSRAPLLNVTYAQAHCISTMMRLRKPTRKMMWTKSHASHAGKPLK